MGSTKFDKEKAAASVRKALRIAPQPDVKGGENCFEPSPFARWMGVPTQTDYHPHEYTKYEGSQKVLVLCTEEKYMTMENGRKFSTGNQPVETMLPMMHLAQAGFSLDICTPNGKPVQLELWAMPERDENVLEYYKEHHTLFENPKSLMEVLPQLTHEPPPYIAVFIPGGHGAMLGLPTNPDVGKLIRWTKDKGLFMITICHGPAVLLAARDENRDHPYKGYRLCAFPDRIDQMSPKIGYLPGPLPWKLCEKLQEQGMEVVNKRASGNVRKDRKLLSGDSPNAANALGKLAADCLLEEVRQQEMETLQVA